MSIIKRILEARTRGVNVKKVFAVYFSGANDLANRGRAEQVPARYAMTSPGGQRPKKLV